MKQRLPEWFVGGPYHGEDKIAKFGPRETRVVLAPSSGNWWEEDRPEVFKYERRRFYFGPDSATIVVWVWDGEIRPWKLLSQILLAPHMIDVPEAAKDETG